MGFSSSKFGDGIVFVGDGIDQLGQGGLGALLMGGRDFGDLVLETFVGEVALAPDDGLLVHHVDDAGELLFSSDVQEDRERVGSELLAHVAQRVVEVGAGAVHLVDERDAGHLVLRGLTPDRLGLGLHAGNAAEHGHGTVQDAHGALHLGGEVHVSRGVDDVDPVGDPFEILVDTGVLLLGPEGGDGGRGDGDAALLFLLHPVGDGVAIIDVTDLVDQAGVEQDTLGRRGLARIDVGANPEVTGALQGILALR